MIAELSPGTVVLMRNEVKANDDRGPVVATHGRTWSAHMGIVIPSPLGRHAAVPYSRDWGQYTGSRWLPAGQRSTESMKSSISWTIDPPTCTGPEARGTLNAWSSGLHGFDREDATWEPGDSLQEGAIDAISDYWAARIPAQLTSTPRSGRQQKQDRRIEKLQASLVQH